MELLTKDELLCEVRKLEKEKNDIWEGVYLSLAKLTHELKTPLNSITGFGELIQYRTDDEKVLSYSDNILKCSKHLLSLVQNISDITTFHQKPIKLSYSIFNSGETIKEIIESFNNKDIKYTLIYNNICADYTRFKQLVYNLISNSLKFSDNKPVKIMTYLNKRFFCFEIKDYGEGIAETDYDKIFDLFTQVSTNKKDQIGSGIGLPLCKIITNAHGGDIQVVSEISRGSTFTFRLPIDKVTT
ncbi:MAG: HAMP domain-containing histidine kinase [Cyanobacteria bacterium RUI128]|nr:HAMP domain-containing histidine kinase [Cyanobacteria bacterium RUI128]